MAEPPKTAITAWQCVHCKVTISGAAVEFVLDECPICHKAQITCVNLDCKQPFEKEMNVCNKCQTPQRQSQEQPCTEVQISCVNPESKDPMDNNTDAQQKTNTLQQKEQQQSPSKLQTLCTNPDCVEPLDNSESELCSKCIALQKQLSMDAQAVNVCVSPSCGELLPNKEAKACPKCEAPQTLPKQQSMAAQLVCINPSCREPLPNVNGKVCPKCETLQTLSIGQSMDIQLACINPSCGEPLTSEEDKVCSKCKRPQTSTKKEQSMEVQVVCVNPSCGEPLPNKEDKVCFKCKLPQTSPPKQQSMGLEVVCVSPSCGEPLPNEEDKVCPKHETSQTSPIQGNYAHQIMLRYNDKLVTALSLDPQGIASILLAKGLISEHTEAEMQQSSTSSEKATILVTAVRQVIKISPRQFHVFLDILSEQVWMKDITEELKSCIDHEQFRKDAGVQVVSNGGQSSTDNECKSGSDISSNGEDYTFPKLNSEDKAELEAQLVLNVDSMRKKFASLLVSVVNSFKRQGYNPRELATATLALTEYNDPDIGKPLLEKDKDALMKAQTVDHSFDVLRPHMTFFNYEILEFLIEEMGSSDDKCKLQKFLQDFKRFCRRSIFEIPPNMLGHSAEKLVDQQKFCVKITKQFKAALLVQCKELFEPDSQSTSSTQLSSSHEVREGICAPELGISLEDAKHIQRKLASVLKLKVSSIYLDSATLGSIILTFLLPSHISLACLDLDPDIIALSSNGIHILCGPPGKPVPKEVTSNCLVVQWSQPEYGRPSLAKYILYYQKKCSETKPLSEWQKLELSSLETHTCVPDLSDGDTYVFKICAVSDVGTLQYSDDSDPIVIFDDANNIHSDIVADEGILTSAAFLSTDPSPTAAVLFNKGVVSKDDEQSMDIQVVCAGPSCGEPLPNGDDTVCPKCRTSQSLLKQQLEDAQVVCVNPNCGEPLPNKDDKVCSKCKAPQTSPKKQQSVDSRVVCVNPNCGEPLLNKEDTVCYKCLAPQTLGINPVHEAPKLDQEIYHTCQIFPTAYPQNSDKNMEVNPNNIADGDTSKPMESTVDTSQNPTSIGSSVDKNDYDSSAAAKLCTMLSSEGIISEVREENKTSNISQDSTATTTPMMLKVSGEPPTVLDSDMTLTDETSQTQPNTTSNRKLSMASDTDESDGYKTPPSVSEVVTDDLPSDSKGSDKGKDIAMNFASSQTNLTLLTLENKRGCKHDRDQDESDESTCNISKRRALDEEPQLSPKAVESIKASEGSEVKQHHENSRASKKADKHKETGQPQPGGEHPGVDSNVAIVPTQEVCV